MKTIKNNIKIDFAEMVDEIVWVMENREDPVAVTATQLAILQAENEKIKRCWECPADMELENTNIRLTEQIAALQFQYNRLLETATISDRLLDQEKIKTEELKEALESIKGHHSPFFRYRPGISRTK